MNEFTLGGRKFKIGKLNTFKQFHIVRKLAPTLVDVLPAVKEMQGKKLDSEESFDQAAKVLSPILMGLSKLSDADSEFILYGLLSSVEVQLGNSWAKVATESILMVQDLELPALIQIASRSFMANLSNFFALLPATSPGAR